MKRRIHIIGFISCIVAYISIALITNAYIQTTIKNTNKNLFTYRIHWLISIVSLLTLFLSLIFVLGTGITILNRINDVPIIYKKINIILGILYLFGGMLICPFISIYLYIKE